MPSDKETDRDKEGSGWKFARDVVFSILLFNFLKKVAVMTLA
jgi:hypothetical protein